MADSGLQATLMMLSIILDTDIPDGAMNFGNHSRLSYRDKW
jgi:hypothetical protein